MAIYMYMVENLSKMIYLQQTISIWQSFGWLALVCWDESHPCCMVWGGFAKEPK